MDKQRLLRQKFVEQLLRQKLLQKLLRQRVLRQQKAKPPQPPAAKVTTAKKAKPPQPPATKPTADGEAKPTVRGKAAHAKATAAKAAQKARRAADQQKEAVEVEETADEEAVEPEEAAEGDEAADEEEAVEVEDAGEGEEAEVPPEVSAKARQGILKRRHADGKVFEEQKAARISFALLEDDPDWTAIKTSKDPNWVPASKAAFPPALGCTPIPLATNSEASTPAPSLTPEPVKVKLEAGAQDAVDHAKAKANKFASAAYAARYARFRRNIAAEPDDPTKARRMNRPPPELALKIRTAHPKNFQMFFGLFCDASADWAQFQVLLKKVEEKSHEAGTILVWKTKPELMKKYKDEAIVNAIFQYKQQDADSWRPNPDAPTCIEAIEVKVLADDWEEQRTKVTESAEANGQFTVYATAGQAFAAALGNAGQQSVSSVDTPLAIQDASPASLLNVVPGVPAAPGSESAGVPKVPGVPAPLKTMEERIREAQAKADRLAAERANKQSDAKEEHDRMKNGPVLQAKKMAVALHKYVAQLHVLQLDVASSRATNDQKVIYKKKFESISKEITKAKDKLQQSDNTNAEENMQEGKTIQEKIKDAFCSSKTLPSA